MLTIMKRPGIINQLYFSMTQKLLPPKPKAAPDHLFALQVHYLGDGNVDGRGSGVAVGGGCDDDDNGDEGSEKDLTSQSNTKVSPSQRFKPGV